MPTDVITRTESRGTGKYEQLLARCKGMTATPTAVAHPCDDASLGAVVEAARAGIIAPILVGPVERIRTVAKTCGLDIEQYEIVAVWHGLDLVLLDVEPARLGDGPDSLDRADQDRRDDAGPGRLDHGTERGVVARMRDADRLSVLVITSVGMTAS